MDGCRGITFAHGVRDENEFYGFVFGFLNDHPAVRAIIHVVHGEGVEAARGGLDFRIRSLSVGGADLGEREGGGVSPLVRPIFAGDFEIVVFLVDGLHRDAPGTVIQRHRYVVPVVPATPVAALVLGVSGSKSHPEGEADRDDSHPAKGKVE